MFVAWDSQYIYLNDIDFGTEVFYLFVERCIGENREGNRFVQEVPMSRGAMVKAADNIESRAFNDL